ncbi:MAG: aspartate carbamoyltransferase regulatory subunit [Candidatus Kapabacteria bacterium]|nr:aspartate carbamoyltransferase regulatory subunit [Ignavibacteriota bacterium]MCW5883941.1 aspartate carbamoyltransferase regulatory subunit [Candidatus Kapabacteria bacterium]
MAKELIVSAIENGTVIDHIPTKSVFQVIKILNLENVENQILFGINLESKKYGKKGIIKVRNRFFESSDINKISLAAPKATLIVIKDFQVIEKSTVEIPDTIEGIVKCFNPNCITNVQNVDTKFKVISKDKIVLQCHYCEKNTVEKNIVFK